MGAVLFFLVQTFFGGATLWLGARVCREQLHWRAAFVIALVSAVAGALVDHFVGIGLLSYVCAFAVTLFGLYRFSSIDNIWPSGVLVVVVSQLIVAVVQSILMLTLNSLL